MTHVPSFRRRPESSKKKGFFGLNPLDSGLRRNDVAVV